MIVLPDLMMITFRTLLFANLIMVIFSRYRELLLRVLMLLLLYNPRGRLLHAHMLHSYLGVHGTGLALITLFGIGGT